MQLFEVVYKLKKAMEGKKLIMGTPKPILQKLLLTNSKLKISLIPNQIRKIYVKNWSNSLKITHFTDSNSKNHLFQTLPKKKTN